ncbi:hypothetical protein CCP4SC76_5050001 [Gammaproteobacteria bacterium]
MSSQNSWPPPQTSPSVPEQDCSEYWKHANEVPLDYIIRYWCEKSGHGVTSSPISGLTVYIFPLYIRELNTTCPE